jgi:ADP-ribosyl-[dinitrogen reductase] hydrolase
MSDHTPVPAAPATTAPASSALRERIYGCLFGLAVGDAVGAAVEFKPRGSFVPLTDMVGGGTWGLPAGHWTDDTSMALCLAESLVESGGFDPLDQMQRYVRWWREGYWSSIDHCFDIGMTTSHALARFQHSGDPMAGSTDPGRAGNGSIMRLAPVVLYFARRPAEALRAAEESSRTTHGAPAAVESCRLLATYLLRALNGLPKEEVLAPVSTAGFAHPGVRAIAEGTWKQKSRELIKGSGYVVESLEASLWCFAQTESYREAVLAAANLGDDADTTGAVTGQIAGAFHGFSSLPAEWLAQLARREAIAALTERLFAAA